MSNHPRPVLLGYIRADRLASATEIHRVEADLATFAHREQFSLGTVYVEKGTSAGVFHALMDELARDDAAWGLVVPDLRHLTVVEHLVLRGSDDGRTPVVVASHCQGTTTESEEKGRMMHEVLPRHEKHLRDTNCAAELVPRRSS